MATTVATVAVASLSLGAFSAKPTRAGRLRIPTRMGSHKKPMNDHTAMENHQPPRSSSATDWRKSRPQNTVDREQSER